MSNVWMVYGRKRQLIERMTDYFLWPTYDSESQVKRTVDERFLKLVDELGLTAVHVRMNVEFVRAPGGKWAVGKLSLVN